MEVMESGHHSHDLEFLDHTHDHGNLRAYARMQRQAANDNNDGTGGEYTHPNEGRRTSGWEQPDLNMKGHTAVGSTKHQNGHDSNTWNSNNMTNYATGSSGGMKWKFYYGGSHKHIISSWQWDNYTMPYAYTINWIIKHDN